MKMKSSTLCVNAAVMTFFKDGENMREILFRGQDIAGNWCYGVPLVFTDDFVCMTAPHTYNKVIEKNTLSQFTGLTDKNGKKIFEGDILKGAWNTIFQVYFDDCYLRFGAKDKDGYCKEIDYYGLDTLEIIGNIYDNPELLKGAK